MTTQVPALSAIDVRPGEPQQRAQDRPVEQRIPHRRLPAAAADALPRRREFRRRRYRTFLSRARPSLSRSRAGANGASSRSRCFLARSGADSTCAGTQWGPARLQASLRDLADRPDERRPAAGRRPQMHGDMAAAAGGETFEQALQHAGAGRVIIADIGHQLPGLLPDLERTVGLADLGDIVLRFEQRAQERRELLRAASAVRQARCAISSKYCMPISLPVRCSR